MVEINQEDSTVGIDFIELFVANQRRVFGYVLTALPRMEDAREVFQATCIVLLNKASQYTPGTDFARWACQIAYFEICNYRRKRHRDLMILDSQVLDTLASKQVENWDQAERRARALEVCLSRLSQQDRELIKARYQRDVTARQLAADLSRPADTVYKALRRIRRRLQYCIEKALAREEHIDG